MYNKEFFYGLTDILHYNVYATLLKDHITKEERVVIKVFKKGNEIVIIETNNFQDTIIKDTRIDKNADLMSYDLIYLKVLERYYSDYEIPGMIYEHIEGLGSWYRVKIPNHNPEDKLYRPFYLKKKTSEKDLNKYAKTPEELSKLKEFYSLTKDLVKFTNPTKIKKLFQSIEE